MRIIDFGGKEYGILTVEDLYGNSVFSRFDYLASYYKEVTENPKEDFSME